MPVPFEPWLRSPVTAVRVGVGPGAHAMCLKCQMLSQEGELRLMVVTISGWAWHPADPETLVVDRCPLHVPHLIQVLSVSEER